MSRVPDVSFWRGRRVLVTGHTGFKGGWLSLWLRSMGAEVHGYALAASNTPSLFDAAGVIRCLESDTVADIRDAGALSAAIRRVRPEVVFHLAAQSLVRQSYQEPVDTYSVNVMGVVHLLEAVRSAEGIRALVSVTSDKCYENTGATFAYQETDPLGGRDPYSSSKACAEIVTAAYRRAFLADRGVAVATARAGNVIGGGDWADARLVPDLFRAIARREPVHLRFPDAVRPWQHVLEPLSGYLILAENLYGDGNNFADAWNFGPPPEDARSVRWVVENFAGRHPDLRWQADSGPQPHEAGDLKLDSRKAHARLGWAPRWRLETALEKTSDWYAAWMRGDEMHALTLAQIRDYMVHDG